MAAQPEPRTWPLSIARGFTSFIPVSAFKIRLAVNVAICYLPYLIMTASFPEPNAFCFR